MRSRNGCPASDIEISSPPVPIASIPIPPAPGVGVSAEQRFSGNAKTLLVNGMAGAVTGAREPHAEAPRGALKQYVVVGVFAVGFDQEMVAVRDCGIRRYLLDAHSLKL